jgi:hypothetical protein
VVYAMPADAETRNTRQAAIPRENTEANVDRTPACWKSQLSSAQPQTASRPVRRERRANLADLQEGVRFRGDRDTRLGRVHSESDPGRFQQEVFENDR